MSLDLCDGNDQITDEPTGERWDPLGANDLDNEVENITDNFSSLCSTAQCLPHERLRALEEEQEILNANLLQLTTHFAQVQFRLRQVVDAPASEKEQLLKSLEEFAFRGVSETYSFGAQHVDSGDRNQLDCLAQRQKQLELIEQLKIQLSELENFTFQTKAPECPTSEYLLEKQRILIDELKYKINVVEEGRSEGDGAASINTFKMREQLVNQFKTQIADLERFIEFLQEGSSQKVAKQCNCSCPVHGTTTKSLNCQYSSRNSRYTDKDVQNQSISLMRKAATLLHMFIVLQFGCGSEAFRKNNLKSCFNHWGDLRARLEVTVGRIEELMKARSEYLESHPELKAEDCINDTDELASFNSRIICMVRKQLAPTLRDLIQHGLIEVYERNNSLVPFIACLSSRSSQIPKKIHAFELILEYYDYKNGDRYNTTPARKLSESFKLELTDSNISHKQSLLRTINSVFSTHMQYKRSYDAQFKAFISAALNANKLVIWLSLIFQCKRIILNHYYAWSYVLKTGFQDSLQSLDRLTPYKFDLPEDLAVRHFQNIKDVFM